MTIKKFIEGAYMTYRKNEEMEYMLLSENSLAIFNHESGDVHFFDAQGIAILNLLSEPLTLEVLITKLCEIYDGSSSDIQADVEELLRKSIEENVVLAL